MILKKVNIALTLFLIILLGACNVMKDNTWSSRALHSLNTRYNVYFNGKVSYDEGLKAILQANKDDYSQVIPMYPISIHENGKSASAQMTRTIEKCRKAIKTRSLKVKPKLTRKQLASGKYKNYLKQEEYNPYMPEVWLLLAQAEFHKADFLGAVGTFNYIQRHFPENKDLGVACQLWKIRAYAEMDWIYEAEEMIGKVNQKELFGDNLTLFVSVYADLMLKKKQYADAIPFLEMAFEKEKDRSLKLRFSFLLGQLYAQTGDKKAAYNAFTRVIDMNPPFEMAFNGRISRAGLFTGKMSDTRQELKKMIKNFNHKEYLDQLYHIMGKTYLYEKDTVKAIENFRKAIESSTRKGMDLAAVQVTLGDLYYNRHDYVNAQPCYEEAAKVLTAEFYDFKRISDRSEMLAGLVVEYQTVVLQDSLQRLAAMTPDERLKTIELYIAKLEAEEKIAAEKEAAKKEQGQENDNPEGDGFMNGPEPPMPVNRGQQGDWYFYNPNLIKTGQTDFQKKWGKRKLEDNWRRLNKSAVMFAENTPENGTPAVENQETNVDGDSIASGESETITDTKNPEFYLRQIPVTPAGIEKSNQIRAEALYKMAGIYQDQLEDYPLAISTFDEYHTKYPGYESASDAVYFEYLLCVKTNRDAEAEKLRIKLISEFPDSKYAQLLNNPKYLQLKKQMFTEQDSVYRMAYEAFNKNDFQLVNGLVDTMFSKYPLSPLMPRFKFLKALSTGKTGTQEAFENELENLISSYPESEVTSISKDMLALVKQGRETKQGTTHGSILARREEELIQSNDSAGLTFTNEINVPHRLVLIAAIGEKELYPLQFRLAVFNFSKFLLKDFELNIARIGQSGNGLSVFDFENKEEATWYLNTIMEDEEIKQLMKELNVNPLIISENNFMLLGSGLTLDEYLIFAAEKSHQN